MTRRRALAGGAVAVALLLVATLSLPPVRYAVAPPGEPVNESAVLARHDERTPENGSLVVSTRTTGFLGNGASEWRTDGSRTVVRGSPPNATYTVAGMSFVRIATADGETRYFVQSTPVFRASDVEQLSGGSVSVPMQLEWREMRVLANGTRILRPANPGIGLVSERRGGILAMVSSQSVVRVTADGFVEQYRLSFRRLGQSGSVVYESDRTVSVSRPSWVSKAAADGVYVTNVTRTDRAVAFTVRNGPLPAETSVSIRRGPRYRLSEPVRPDTRVYVTRNGVTRNRTPPSAVAPDGPVLVVRYSPPDALAAYETTLNVST